MCGSVEVAPSVDPTAAPVLTTGTEMRAPHDFSASISLCDDDCGLLGTPWLLAAVAGIVLGALWSRWKPRIAAPTVVARRRRALRPAAG